MGFHHVALATKDPEATHRFYSGAMGFELVKVVSARTPTGTGWSRHFFYDTTGSGATAADSTGMIAFWELRDEAIGDDWRPGLSKSVGLPSWVNHLAWDAPTLDALEAHKQRWREHGITVAQVDHGFCTSIYATDPNGIMVEFCCTTRAFTDEERGSAERMLFAAEPELEPDPEVRLFEPMPAPALA